MEVFRHIFENVCNFARMIVGVPVIGLLVSASLLTVRPLSAATLAGVTLPDRIVVGNKTLVLNGLGVREVSIFKVRAYVVGLYLESRSSDANEILRSTQQMRLELVFLHEASYSDISNALRDGIRENLKDIQPLEGRLADLASVIPNLKPNDRVIFDISDSSLDIELVGHKRKTIPGIDFSRAVLSIWLGPNPPSDDMKAGLLGK